MLPPKVIMSPIDFSGHSHEALDSAVELASCFRSEICLVHVVPAIPKLPSPSAIFREREYEEELHKDAQNRLEQLAAKIRQRGLTVKTVVATADDVSMELLRVAEHNNVDLIVIATHGMSGWRKLAFGSVTEKVVRLATCPVLMMRIRGEDESADPVKKDSFVASR